MVLSFKEGDRLVSLWFFPPMKMIWLVSSLVLSSKEGDEIGSSFGSFLQMKTIRLGSSLVLSSKEGDVSGLSLVLSSNEDSVIGSSLVLSSKEGDGFGLPLVLSSNEDGVIGLLLGSFLQRR